MGNGGGLLAHIDLATIIVTGVFGVLFSAFVAATVRVSSRLRDLEGDFKRLDERCMTRCGTDQEARTRNDQAHARIEKNIEAARLERIKQIEDLETRLVREFHSANGGK